MSDAATIKPGQSVEPPTQRREGPPISIADHALLRLIGNGTFGEVWLAQSNATGRYRAVKIVYRDRVPTAHSYETEFTGLKRFEEVAREHLGFVDILHISRHDEAGCFYYVMELADDLEGGPRFDPDNYTCRTLAALLRDRGRLPVGECVRVLLVVAEAVAELHRHNLVHRDLKPGNIVFVRGTPKLADVGLVSDASDAAAFTSIVGTPGYLDEAAHGTPAGDIFALGKVLYAMATGRCARDWPDWAAATGDRLEAQDITDLNRITWRACHPDRSRRYGSVAEFVADLRPLLVSPQVRRLQRFAGLISLAKRYAPLAVLVLALLGFGAFVVSHRLRQLADLRQRQVGAFLAQGNRAIETGEALSSLPWLVRALAIEERNPDRAAAHRLRLGCALGQTPNLKWLLFGNREDGQPVFVQREDRLLAPLPLGYWALVDLPERSVISPPFGRGDPDETASITRAGDLAVTSSPHSNQVTLWDIRTGQALRIFGYATNLHAAIISPEGRWVAAAAADFHVVLWEVAQSTPARVFTGHQGEILCLRFNRGGQRLVSGGKDGLLILWDVSGEAPPVTSRIHTSWIYQAAFSPDDLELATACFDRKVRILDSRTALEAAPALPHGDGVHSVDWSPDGTMLASACLGFEVRVWKRAGGQLLWVLPHDTRPVHAVFDPVGRSLLTQTHDGTLRVWNICPALQPADCPVSEWSAGGQYALQYQPDGAKLRGLGDRNQGTLIPIPGGRLLEAALDEQGCHVLLATQSNPSNDMAALRLYSVQTDEYCGPVIQRPLPLSRMVLSAGGRRLALLSSNRTEVLDLLNGQSVLELDEALDLAAFDGTERRLAGVSSNRVRAWRLGSQTRNPPKVLRHPVQVRDLAWSHRGQHLVTVCWDTSFHAEAARVWNMGTGEMAGPPLYHRDGIRFAAFSPDDTRIVTCGEDFNANLWEVRSGRPLAPPLPHRDQVWHAAWSDSGRWVATFSRDGFVRLWDASTGEPITPPLPHPGTPRAVGCLDDGRKLCALNAEGILRTWEIRPETRPATELALLAEVLSARQSTADESMLWVSREKLQAAWEALQPGRPKHPFLPRPPESLFEK